MKPITADERAAWGAELTSATPRTGGNTPYADRETDHARYIQELDFTGQKLLVQATMRACMAGRTKEERIAILEWCNRMGRALVIEDSGASWQHRQI